MFVEKHRPEGMADFVGQKDAVQAFLKFMQGKPKKALLLHGPAGTGKTCLVEAYAKENNMELVQMNASDVRGEEEIQKTLGSASRQSSLFSRRKIILVDEVDGIAGREDSGGVAAIIQLIKQSSYPVVLTANNPWNQRLRPLRQYSTVIEFKRLPVADIRKKLGQISAAEKISMDAVAVNAIAKKSKGDMRSAINDLEIISKGKSIVSMSDIQELGERDIDSSIFELLRKIFKSKSVSDARTSMGSVDLSPDTIFWWIENNITSEYENPEEIAKAYDALSRADVFFHRVRSRQNWRLLAYAIDMMTAGVAVSKKDAYRKFTRYQYPSNISILGSTKVSRKESRDTNLELAASLHCSTKTLKRDYLPLLGLMAKGK